MYFISCNREPPIFLKIEVEASNHAEASAPPVLPENGGIFIKCQIFHWIPNLLPFNSFFLPESFFYQIPSMTQVHLAVEVESTSKASAGVSYPPGKRRKNLQKCPKKFHLQSKSWRQSAHCL